MKNSFITDPVLLLEKLGLDKNLLPAAQKAATLFGLRVPESFLSRIEKGNPHDPLLLQILPLHLELNKTIGFSHDPLEEKQFNPLPGLLHKYESRVLMTFVSICAINCRYCFRREFDYKNNNAGKKGWDKILNYIAERPHISEVILSGGDPLVAPDELLKSFSEKLLTISHVKTLRVHSRLPIVMPERITQDFVRWLKELPLRKVLVLHTNHPNELSAGIAKKMKKLSAAGVMLLNQSVLLKNINDNTEVLIQLSEKLFDTGILPYYLHLLDKVSGAAHFDVSENKAKHIMKTLQEKLPGYLVPRLVREVSGEKHKIMI